MSSTLLTVNNLQMHFPVGGGLLGGNRSWLKAVDGVSLAIRQGETLGLVGESGCGKSTLGKCIVRLLNPTAGSIQFGERDITQLSRRQLKPLRKQMQMVFQDPAESLNPRLTIGETLEEPFIVHNQGSKSERRQKVEELLERVGLPTDAAQRYPFEFSGGQRQRIGIARAIALNPSLIICDEPVSALDVSVQSQVLNLLMDLQRDLGLAYLFIAHDLAVVRHISDRIAVMYLGQIVELAPAEKLFQNPRHAYTRALISAIPRPDPTQRKDRILLRGDVPSPIDPPPGCRFASRSWLDYPEEWKARPGRFMEVEPEHWVEVHPATVENWEDYLTDSQDQGGASR